RMRAGLPSDTVFRIINEETRHAVENPVAKVLRDGEAIALANHTALVGRDGRETPVEDSAAPIRAGGGPVSGTVLVFRDVTESRRALEARLRLAAIVESSDDAILGLDLDGRVASWNRGAERLYGWTAEEMIGRTLSVLMPPGLGDESPAILGRIARGERIENLETRRVRKDGGLAEVSLTVSPIRDADGKVVGASKTARDITARKQAEEALREEDRRKTEFLAVLAHELRNPLAPLRHGLEVLRRAAADPEEADRTRAAMERQVKHLVRLVDDLLDVSRINRGKIVLRKERVGLASVVEQALGVCGQGVREDRRLAVSLPETPAWLDADATRLSQALCNLLGNAVKYGGPGGRIWLEASTEGGEAVLRVRDEGAGIPPEMLSKVFDLFAQVDRTLERSQGGLGVGLALVKRLVELHGGTVEARSEGFGKGSEFIVRLPLAPAPSATQGGEAVEGSGPLGRHRVLVVDDNADASTALASLLTLLGQEARVARDGQEGVESAESFRPDLVLMDIGMPKLDGFDACRRIREQPWGKGIRIVALTGWGQEEDRRRSREAGFDLHLTKPVEPADLERLLASLERRTDGSSWNP
ncbi:MAG: PAS domain S-box protein, partial [Gemmataceae bacterium]|nr:PAS domain S-box protein [Gemmataceae bacterium]